MGRFVLIALFAGCYDPSVADCVDTCAADHLCPDGLTCDGQGFCRVSGASGTCAGSGSGSGSSGSCPMAPQGHGTPECTTAAPPSPAAPDCLVSCEPAASGSAAQAFSLMTWHEATIASAGAETTAKMLATSGPLWTGLRAPAGQGATRSAWTWADGSSVSYEDWASGEPTDHGSAGNCATVGPMGWKSEPCTNSHGFLINTLPMP